MIGRPGMMCRPRPDPCDILTDYCILNCSAMVACRNKDVMSVIQRRWWLRVACEIHGRNSAHFPTTSASDLLPFLVHIRHRSTRSNMPQMVYKLATRSAQSQRYNNKKDRYDTIYRCSLPSSLVLALAVTLPVAVPDLRPWSCGR